MKELVGLVQGRTNDEQGNTLSGEHERKLKYYTLRSGEAICEA